MKCPKCHYLSFDPEPRCRNCGYTLALDPDLAIHPGPEVDTPLADLTLRDSGLSPGAPAHEAPPAAVPRRAPAAAPAEPGRRARTTTPGPFDPAPDESAPERADATAERSLPASATPTGARPAAPGRPAPERVRRQPAPTTELPLFVKGIGTDASAPPKETEDDGADVRADVEEIVPPVVSPPMSARRAPSTSPARAHAAEGPRFGPLDRDLLDGLRQIEHAEQRRAAADAQRLQDTHRVGAGRRLGAAAIDATILGALAAGIVSVTLRWTDLSWGQLQVLPLVPLLAFVLLVATAYLFMFTAASGQTVGKMLMGTRVIDARQPGTEHERVSVRQALYRGMLTVPSVLLLGAGFLPALGRDERAIHDRLTHTRVVRV